jgi:pyruvate,water dikinase
MESQNEIFWFQELAKDHAALVGKKCANLGEMTRLGLNVPPGFALTIALYERFLEDSGLGARIAGYIGTLRDLKDAGVDRLEQISADLRSMIENEPMPKALDELIGGYYNKLCEKVGVLNASVSVRSAGVESRPGMFETYLNIEGRDNVLENVKKVWASAFTPRAIAFRANKGLPMDCDMLGVAIPLMVRAKVAGIGFTVDPVTADASGVVIEANWGLGEGVVAGSESADCFRVRKENYEIEKREIGNKIRCVAFKEKGAEWENVPEEKRCIPCLKDEEIKAIAALGKLLEERMGCAQDFEWALDERIAAPGNVFLLQTRPAKVMAKKAESKSEQIASLMAKRIYKIRDKVQHTSE